MFEFKFEEIFFFSGTYNEIKKKADQGGVLVAPAASALANIKKDQRYYESLKNSDIAILDSGFFCILLRIFKRYKLIKLSGYLFLNRFINEYDPNDKLFLVNPSKKEDEINKNYLNNKNIKKIESYVAPFYQEIKDEELIDKINLFRPKYIMINLGGGTQEPLGVYIKNNIKFNVTIICTGAAIAFLTKEQAPINKIVDKLYLGWLIRLLWNPSNYKRILSSFRLIAFFLKR